MSSSLPAFIWATASRAPNQSEVPTPWDWTPRTMAPAILPETRGSSEKYSKCLPPSGFLWVLSAGPSNTSAPYSFTSFPMAAPTRSTRATSQEDASSVAIGKAVQ